MLEVSFNRRPGISPGLLPEETLPLDRFLYQIPNLLMHSQPRPPFPPFSILNEILRGGIEDIGMSGGLTWLPFNINARDYVQAVVALRARDAYMLDPPPPWVKSIRDWNAWKLEILFGTKLPPDAQSRAPTEQVRTEADDELMRIAKDYSDAQRAQDEHALQHAERTLQAFLETHPSYR